MIMKKIGFAFFIILLFLFSVSVFAEKKEEKKDSPPQKDKYHNNFDDMDEQLEKSIEDEENKYQDPDSLKRREKKTFTVSF